MNAKVLRPGATDGLRLLRCVLTVVCGSPYWVSKTVGPRSAAIGIPACVVISQEMPISNCVRTQKRSGDYGWADTRANAMSLILRRCRLERVQSVEATYNEEILSFSLRSSTLMDI